MIKFGPRLSRLQTCMRSPATVPPGAGLPQPLFCCTEGVPMATGRRLSVRLLMAWMRSWANFLPKRILKAATICKAILQALRMSQWFQTEVQGSPCPLIPVTGIHFFLSVSFAMENPPINFLRRWCHLRLITGSSLLLNWSKTGEICWNHAVTTYSSYLCKICKILEFVITAQGWLDGRMAYVPFFLIQIHKILIWLSP